MRLIDADRLMQALYVMRDRETDTPKMMANWFLSIIDEQPTVEQGWIPVSERLPKCVKPVLVTVNIPSFTKPYTSMDYTTSEGDWKSYDNEYITAWQPLPQPYKE